MRPGRQQARASVPHDAEWPDLQLDALLEAEVTGNLPPLLLFWGHKARDDHPGPWVLSQWWPSPIEVDDVRYLHAEGYMMAEKARLFGDEGTRQRIITSAHPAEAKRLGRLVRGFDETAWAAARFDIVSRGNLAKFSRHDDLRRYLASTTPQVLVEASPRDPVWGIGLSAQDERAGRLSEWRGQNLLGFALMEVRSRLSP